MNKLKTHASYGEPDAKDKRELVNGLTSHHKSHGHIKDPKTYSIFLKDDEGGIHGGIIVSFLWNSMKIESLWIDEKVRGQGLGAQLMSAAEDEAVKRNCTFVYTNTFSWQAPDFYRKLGYQEFGRLENFPQGESLMYLKKELGD